MRCCHNNFSFPSPSDEQKAKIEQTTQAILDARALYPDASLADLYDDLAMPPELRKAHQDNDRAVMEAGRVVEVGDVFDILANPRQPVTQSFVSAATNLTQIHRLIEQNAPVTQIRPGECIMRMKYLERSSSEALVSQLSRRFDLDLNIIFGSIEMIGDNPLGGLIVTVSGAPERIDGAIQYLKDKNVEVEVLVDARIAG